MWWRDYCVAVVFTSLLSVSDLNWSVLSGNRVLWRILDCWRTCGVEYPMLWRLGVLSVRRNSCSILVIQPMWYSLWWASLRVSFYVGVHQASLYLVSVWLCLYPGRCRYSFNCCTLPSKQLKEKKTFLVVPRTYLLYIIKIIFDGLYLIWRYSIVSYSGRRDIHLLLLIWRCSVVHSCLFHFMCDELGD
jgi:hypothetical protein